MPPPAKAMTRLVAPDALLTPTNYFYRVVAVDDHALLRRGRFGELGFEPRQLFFADAAIRRRRAFAFFIFE